MLHQQLLFSAISKHCCVSSSDWRHLLSGPFLSPTCYLLLFNEPFVVLFATWYLSYENLTKCFWILKVEPSAGWHFVYKPETLNNKLYKKNLVLIKLSQPVFVLTKDLFSIPDNLAKYFYWANIKMRSRYCVIVILTTQAAGHIKIVLCHIRPS